VSRRSLSWIAYNKPSAFKPVVQLATLTDTQLLDLRGVWERLLASSNVGEYSFMKIKLLRHMTWVSVSILAVMRLINFCAKNSQTCSTTPAYKNMNSFLFRIQVNVYATWVNSCYVRRHLFIYNRNRTYGTTAYFVKFIYLLLIRRSLNDSIRRLELSISFYLLLHWPSVFRLDKILISGSGLWWIWLK
jgi:hypothetical protein